jgi:hypothetical protein
VKVPTRVAAVSMLLFPLLTACEGGTGIGIPRESTPSAVPIGARDFAGIAWLSSDWLIVGLNPGNISAPNEVWRLRPDGEDFNAFDYLTTLPAHGPTT